MATQAQTRFNDYVVKDLSLADFGRKEIEIGTPRVLARISSAANVMVIRRRAPRNFESPSEAVGEDDRRIRRGGAARAGRVFNTGAESVGTSSRSGEG